MPTLTTNTDTDDFTVTGPAHIHCSGGFGAGTITWKFEGADGTYHDLANGAFTAAADKTFNFSPERPTNIKGTLSGATAPTLYYEVRGNVT